jgi:hypothetical protein
MESLRKAVLPGPRMDECLTFAGRLAEKVFRMNNHCWMFPALPPQRNPNYATCSLVAPAACGTGRQSRCVTPLQRCC